LLQVKRPEQKGALSAEFEMVLGGLQHACRPICYHKLLGMLKSGQPVKELFSTRSNNSNVALELLRYH